jgi:aryl-phospho-beta-D-glucosidase BglC (GH1 family)
MSIKNTVFAGFLLLLTATACSVNVDVRDGAADKISASQQKIAFWSVNRRGTNIFNTRILRDDIKAAKAYGVQFVRICLDKFPSKQRDFLIGNADNYVALDPDDLAFLKQILDLFTEEEMPVVITMLSLPGSRWNQLNNGKDDLRIWVDAKFQQQAARFWRDLATALRNYPIIVGYNILNEPHPERLFDSKSCHIDAVNQGEVQQFLSVFNDLIVKSIRAVDQHTPIIIDSSGYADPNTFKNLRTIADPLILYSFHMYEPYHYTNHKHNTGQYSYPGVVEGKHWDRAALKEYMSAVATFQRKYKIPSNRILVGEFGCYRKQKGLPQYFSDLISIFEAYNWHWAFYAFRDNWDGMDYELGAGALPWDYWKARDRGEGLSA